MSTTFGASSAATTDAAPVVPRTSPAQVSPERAVTRCRGTFDTTRAPSTGTPPNLGATCLSLAWLRIPSGVMNIDETTMRATITKDQTGISPEPPNCGVMRTMAKTGHAPPRKRRIGYQNPSMSSSAQDRYATGMRRSTIR